jgi:hypothetical protein
MKRVAACAAEAISEDTIFQEGDMVLVLHEALGNPKRTRTPHPRNGGNVG